MNCPLCSSDNISEIHNRVWSLENGSVFRCKKCDVSFIDPIMTELQEKEFYRNYNEHAAKRGFINIGNPDELHSSSIPIAQERFEIIKNFLTKAKSVLEIGTSSGAFLELLRGVECYGVEPNKDNRTFSKKFCRNTWEDLSQVPENLNFDIICMFHVFEHIRNPSDFLKNCIHHLNPGGKILIEVPCIDDPLISLYECASYKDFYFQPMHPYIYSRASLEKVFFDVGLNDQEFIHYQRYGLANHLAWLSLGKPGGDPVFNQLFGNLKEYKTTLEKAGKTDTLILSAGLK